MRVRTLLCERRNGGEWDTCKEFLIQDETKPVSLKELTEKHKEMCASLVFAPGKEYKIETRTYMGGNREMSYITWISNVLLQNEAEGTE